MRIRIGAILLLSSCAVAAFAAEPQRGFHTAGVFLSDMSYTSSTARGSQLDGGIGLSLGYDWSERLSTQLSMGVEKHTQTYPAVKVVNSPEYGNVAIGFEAKSNRYTFPIDLVTTYRFLNDSRWIPYLGAGARYINPPGAPGWYLGSHNGEVGQVPGPEPFHRRVSAELDGGVMLRLTGRTSLEVDLKRLAGASGITPFDPLWKPSVGLNFKF